MQFRQDRPQREKYMAFETFGEETELFCSVKPVHIDRTKTFLRRSDTTCMALDRYQLAELKYATSAE